MDEDQTHFYYNKNFASNSSLAEAVFLQTALEIWTACQDEEKDRIRLPRKEACELSGMSPVDFKFCLRKWQRLGLLADTDDRKNVMDVEKVVAYAEAVIDGAL